MKKGQYIKVPAAAKQAAKNTLTAFGCPPPQQKPGKMRKTGDGQYAIKVDGLPDGAAETLETYRHFGKK